MAKNHWERLEVLLAEQDNIHQEAARIEGEIRKVLQEDADHFLMVGVLRIDKSALQRRRPKNLPMD